MSTLARHENAARLWIIIGMALVLLDLVWNSVIWAANPIESLVLGSAAFCLIAGSRNRGWTQGYQAGLDVVERP